MSSYDLYQAQPLDLSCKAERHEDDDGGGGGGQQQRDDRRRLSSGGSSSCTDDRSASRSPDSLEGGPRKRFLSKFFQPQVKGMWC